MLKRKKRYEVLFWLEIVEPLGKKRKSKEPKDLNIIVPLNLLYLKDI